MGLSIIIYRIITGFYFKSLQLASIFNKKAKLWVNGRKNIFESLEDKLKIVKSTQKKYWFHCASLGEFEQGRPLIEAIKRGNPECFIILSFFSPSGYELRKNYKGADLISYLPTDTPSNAVKWYEILKPDAVFFIKYEFWYFYLREASKRETPLFLISAHFRSNQIFFNNFGVLHRKMLSFFSHVFVQDKSSESLLKTIGISNVLVSGDTRFDRVEEIKLQNQSLKEIHDFKSSQKLFICGSTWPVDEKILLKFWQNYLRNKDWKMIIAPHEISPEKIQILKSSFEKTSPTLLYSNIQNEADLEKYRILIIDNIGLLSRIYAYANAAYIGGGFGKGIHNSLEAAVYGIPVFFGPKNHKFIEAKSLKNIGQAFKIERYDEISNSLDNLNYELIKVKSETYFKEQINACGKILSKISLDKSL